MRLDLLVATFRRQALLLQLLESIRLARKPSVLDLHVIVIDNDASESLSAVEHWATSVQSLFRVTVIQESRPGKSAALNAGLALASAEFVAFADDDELLDASWFEVAMRELSTGGYDFIGGRSLPLWQRTPPRWLPPTSAAVLGIVDPAVPSQDYSLEFPGILSGGNAIVRLDLLRRLGGFSTQLGPRHSYRLLSGEDEDLYWRLVESGARGRYVPDLIVHHHIHADRLSKRYYRAWHFWNGTATGMLSRTRRQPVPHIAGIPRYLYGHAVRGLLRWLTTIPGRGSRIAHELPLWRLAGFWYGRHWHGPREPVPRRDAKQVPAL